MDVESAAQPLTSLLFSTLLLYHDRQSQASVERAISLALTRSHTFIRAFTAALIQTAGKLCPGMGVEKVVGSKTGGALAIARHKLLKWSCLLLRSPRGLETVTASRAAFSRLVAVQAGLLGSVLVGPERLKRAVLHAFDEMLAVVSKTMK